MNFLYKLFSKTQLVNIYAWHYSDTQKKTNACLRVCKKAVGNEEVNDAWKMMECCSGKEEKKKRGGVGFG